MWRRYWLAILMLPSVEGKTYQSLVYISRYFVLNDAEIDTNISGPTSCWCRCSRSVVVKVYSAPTAYFAPDLNESWRGRGMIEHTDSYATVSNMLWLCFTGLQMFKVATQSNCNDQYRQP